MTILLCDAKSRWTWFVPRGHPMKHSATHRPKQAQGWAFAGQEQRVVATRAEDESVLSPAGNCQENVTRLSFLSCIRLRCVTTSACAVRAEGFCRTRFWARRRRSELRAAVCSG